MTRKVGSTSGGNKEQMYYSTKTYGNDRGLSCCFRQPNATHSHCSLLHGYAIGVKFVFCSETLDDNNWCFDFGGMKPIKAWLDHMFDHTVVIAETDTCMHHFERLADVGLCNLRKVPAVGCEGFAKLIYDKTAEIISEMKEGKNTRYPINPDVRIKSVEVFEHGSNSAIYEE